LTATSSVSVTVVQTLSGPTVSPATATVAEGTTQSFVAAGQDQFGNPMMTTVTWSVSGAGTINASSGLYTSTGSGAATVTASSGSLTATASVTTVAVTDAGGVYNGNAFTATASVNGQLTLPGVSLAYYVGTWSAVSQLSGLTPLGGAPRDVGNYTVEAAFSGNAGPVMALAQFTISQAPLIISAITDTKFYDGTTSSSQTPTYMGLVSGDRITGLTQVFQSPNVLANGSTLVVTPGYQIINGSGDDVAGDYDITLNNASGTINPAQLTIAAVTDTRTYDGTTDSSATPAFQVTSANADLGETKLAANTLYGSDTVTGLTQAFASRNVLSAGSTLVVLPGYTINDVNGGHNYAVTTATASGMITPAALTIDAVTDSKTYDGATAATATPVVVGTLYGTDTVSGLAQAFMSKDVQGRNGSTLLVTAYTVNDGNQGKNYTVTTNPARGTITPAALTIDAVTDSKTYSGTTADRATPVVVGTLYGTDTVSGLAQAFMSKDVEGANGSTLFVTAYTVNDGNQGKNYTVTLQSAAGTITPAALTIAADDESKVFGAPLPVFAASFQGFVKGDSLQSLAGTLIFSTSATALSPAGVYTITAGGLRSSDYAITFVPGQLTVVATSVATEFALLVSSAPRTTSPELLPGVDELSAPVTSTGLTATHAVVPGTNALPTSGGGGGGGGPPDPPDVPADQTTRSLVNTPNNARNAPLLQSGDAWLREALALSGSSGGTDGDDADQTDQDELFRRWGFVVSTSKKTCSAICSSKQAGRKIARCTSCRRRPRNPTPP
jgi:hypothetical protein